MSVNGIHIQHQGEVLPDDGGSSEEYGAVGDTNPAWYSFLPLRRFLAYRTAAAMRVTTRKASTAPTAMTTLLLAMLLPGGGALPPRSPEDCVDDLLGLLLVCGLAGSTAVAGAGSCGW